MIVHDSWWSNGSARSTIIDYHEPFDQGLRQTTTIIAHLAFSICRLITTLYDQVTEVSCVALLHHPSCIHDV